jgi:hypothetical protein
MAKTEFHFREDYELDDDAEPEATDFRSCKFPASTANPRDDHEAAEIVEAGFARLDRVTDFREFARIRALQDKHHKRR